MKKFTIISIVLIAMITTTNAQYSNATLNGAWFMYQAPLTPYGDSLMYMIFDGNGNITAWSGFGSINGSNYTVNASGAISGTLIVTGEGSFPFVGQLNSQGLGNITADGMNYVLTRIANPGALTDTLSGVLITNGYGQKNIMLKLNQLGEIISATGLTPPVSGRVYTHLGVFMGHIITGDTLNNQAWGELSLYGYYSNDSLIGEVVVDAPQNSLRTGPATLKRSGVVTPVGVKTLESNSNTILIYPNPANEIVTINLNNLINEVAEIKIFSAIGTLVKSKTIKQNNQQINTRDLSNGIYMVVINSKEWTGVQKLFIQR